MDSRAPITSRNKQFLVSTPAPRIALYNKIDLSALSETEKDLLREREFELGATHVFFGSGSKLKSDLIQSDLLEAIEEAVGRNRNPLDGSIEIQIVGMPNVGKSTLLNSLRRSHSLLPGNHLVKDEPGITKEWTDNTKQYYGGWY